jgi:hypothetical protein
MGSIKIQYFNIVKPLNVLTGPAVLCFLCAGYLFGVPGAGTSGKHLAGLKANRWARLSEEFRTDSGGGVKH